MLIVDSLGIMAGVGLILVGTLGTISTKSNLWRPSFAMFAVSGLLLSSNSAINVFCSLGIISQGVATLEATLMASFILLIMGTSLVLHVLAGLHRNSTFSTVLVPRESFAKMSRRLEKMYGKHGARHVMYSLGKDAECDRAREVRDRLGMDNNSIMKWLPEIFSIMGWAENTEVVEYVPKENLIIRTVGNFESQIVPSDGVTSCNFLRGSIAGMSKALHPGMECEATETKCQSLGDEYCEFAVSFFHTLPWGLVRIE